jgi:hypothetical protein
LAKAAGALALLLVLSVFMVNALWPDMSADLPAWLKPYAQLLTSN